MISSRSQHWGDVCRDSGLSANGDYWWSQHPMDIDCQHINYRHYRCWQLVLDRGAWPDFWIIDSRQQSGYAIGKIRPGEWQMDQDLHRAGVMTPLNVTGLLHPDTWISCYHDLAAQTDITVDTAHARELWHRWYDLRVVRHWQRFQTLSVEDHARYSRQRRFEDHHGSSHHWYHLYRGIRDPSWPHCDLEADFWDLPQHIQQECREEFGYEPPAPIA